jgi:hypothetical protein
MSKATVDRGSARQAVTVASSMPTPLAHSGVNVCHVKASRRYGSESMITWAGSLTTRPISSWTIE